MALNNSDSSSGPFVLVFSFFLSQVVRRRCCCCSQCHRRRCATNHAGPPPPSFATLFPKYNPHIVKLNNAPVHQAIFFLLFFLLLAPTCRFFLNCCTRYEHGMSKRALLLLRTPKKRSRLHLKPIEKKNIRPRSQLPTAFYLFCVLFSFRCSQHVKHCKNQNLLVSDEPVLCIGPRPRNVRLGLEILQPEQPDEIELHLDYDMGLLFFLLPSSSVLCSVVRCNKNRCSYSTVASVGLVASCKIKMPDKRVVNLVLVLLLRGH